MRRLAIAIIAIIAILPMTMAVADDQVCTDLTIEWTDQGQPYITDTHYATTGVRVALIGDYLWTQYETTSDYNDGGPPLSTLVTPGVSTITACPDGTVTLITPPPPVLEDPDAVIGDSVTVVDVIVYWQNRGYQVYPE